MNQRYTSQDEIQRQLEYAALTSPSALRDRLLSDLFIEVSKQGVQGWAHLANSVFFAVARRYGPDTASKIFKGSGPAPKRLMAALRNAAILDRLDRMQPKSNIAKLARELAAENKKLPRERRRGAGGTRVQTLEDHIRDLNAARKKRYNPLKPRS